MHFDMIVWSLIATLMYCIKYFKCNKLTNNILKRQSMATMQYELGVNVQKLFQNH